MLTVEISMMHHQGLTDLTPKSYTALGLMNIGPSAITVSEKSPYQNMNDLLTAIKANHGKLKASGTEIGRASCRESMCKYVEISVVACTFKKNKINKKNTK